MGAVSWGGAQGSCLPGIRNLSFFLPSCLPSVVYFITGSPPCLSSGNPKYLYACIGGGIKSLEPSSGVAEVLNLGSERTLTWK